MIDQLAAAPEQLDCRAEARDLIASGFTREMVAIALGVSETTARRWAGPASEQTNLRVAERFWRHVAGEDPLGCWQWQGSTRSGYGAFWTPCGVVRAHKWAYENLRVEVPLGLSLDHLCRDRLCVNPWHLEPVTHAVNNRRSRLARKAPGQTAGWVFGEDPAWLSQ